MDLTRRIHALIGRAILRRVDEGAVQKLQVDHGPTVKGASIGLVDDVQHAVPFGFASSPVPGLTAITASAAGNRTRATVLGFLANALRPGNLQRGDACLYDSRGRRVWLTTTGIVVDANGASVTVVNATTVRLECETLQVTGDIVDNCDGNTVTLAALRMAYNEHKHGGVQAGAVKSDVSDHLAV
jgi:phage gp45-like